jgi:hypothetical protein
MTLSCGEVRARFEGYAAEALPSTERAAFREHLADCDGCRAEASSSDPSLLFAVARPEIASSEETAAILASVRSAIAVRSAERRLARRKNRLGLAAAAAVVALLGIALVRPGNRTERSARAVARPPSAQTVEPAAAPFAPAAEARPDSKFPASATVYDWNPGGGQPRVVWIVDRSLDI